MSVKFMGIGFELALKPLETLVLLALADHSDHNGNNAYPGIDMLAWKTGLSVREVQYILRGFEKKGIAVRRRGGIGRGHFVVYDLNLDGAPRKSPLGVASKRVKDLHPSGEQRVQVMHPSGGKKVQDVHPSKTEKGAPEGTKRVHHSARKGAPQRKTYKEDPSLTVHETTNNSHGSMNGHAARSENPLLLLLVEEGITERAAEKLIEDFPEDAIRSKVEAFQTIDKSRMENPPGLLRAWIECRTEVNAPLGEPDRSPPAIDQSDETYREWCRREKARREKLKAL